MKNLMLVIIFMVCACAASAQDTPKSFDEMTYEELQRIEADTLSKQAKKVFKKALKKAKRAEEKRIKAEEKRLHAIRKAQQKRDKAIQKRLKKVRKYYDHTSLNRDEFSANIEVAGPLISSNMDWTNLFFGSRLQPKFALVAILNPQNNETSFHMPVSMYTSVSGLSLPSLQLLDITPAEYASIKNIWPDHHQAYLTGGIARDVTIFEQEVDECTVENCYFLERFSVQLRLNDILDAVKRRSELAVKINAHNEPAMVVRVRFEYLLGFIDRLSEANGKFSELGQIAAKGRDHIIETTIK